VDGPPVFWLFVYGPSICLSDGIMLCVWDAFVLGVGALLMCLIVCVLLCAVL